MTDLQSARVRAYFDGKYFRPDPQLWERLRRNLDFDNRVCRRGVRTRVLLALAVFALLATASTVPVAAGASPIAPVPRAVLGLAGLAPVTERFMPVEGSATWSGFKISLSAVYADDLRTIIVLQAEPQAKADRLLVDSAVAFDAYGHPLGSHGGTFLDGGYYVLRFDPVPNRRSSSAKVTVFIWKLVARPTRPNDTAPKETMFGVWSLQFTVTSQGGHVLATPAPGQAGKMGVTFNAVRAAPGVLAIDFTTRGVLSDQRCRHPIVTTPGAGSAPGTRAVTCRADEYVPAIRVYDPNGQELHMQDGGSAITGQAMLNRKEERWSSMWPVTERGAYRVVISDPDGATLERTIEVP